MANELLQFKVDEYDHLIFMLEGKFRLYKMKIIYLFILVTSSLMVKCFFSNFISKNNVNI